jgi:DNA-binding SARP family transcriptional activator
MENELSNVSAFNDSTSVHSFDAQTVLDLLEDGCYEDVANILLTAYRDCQETGNTVSAELLAAVRQLCIQCHQSRIEAEWHGWAKEEAIRRERTLRHHIAAILDHIAVSESSFGQQSPLEITLAHRRPVNLLEPPHKTFWGRVQKWLRPTRRPGLTDPDAKEAAEPSSSTLSSSPRSLSSAADCASAESQSQTITLAVYCLGPFRIYLNDRPVTRWNGNKSQTLFKYLIAQRSKQIPKDVLMDLFWPNMDPDAARRNLHQAIYCLRQTLRQYDSQLNHILFDNDCYFLNPGISVWVDTEEFESHAEIGVRLEIAGQVEEAVMHYGVAENLYRGEYLEEDLYEEWTIPIRDRLRTLYLNVADRLSEYYARKGEHAVAINLCHRMLAQDNCHEGAHRRLMYCYLAQGQRHLAIRQYHICQETLRSELNLDPSPETQAIMRSIKLAPNFEPKLSQN